MTWKRVSWHHLLDFFTTKRGIIITILGGLFNGFIVFSQMRLLVSASSPLSPSEIESIRSHATDGAITIDLIWGLALAFEGAYLFNNGLLNRFLLNGFNRWQWGHTLLLGVGIMSLLLGFLQTLFINGVGYVLFDIQALGWGTSVQLALRMAYLGGFTLFLIALFPSYLISFGIIGWLQIESILTLPIVMNKLGDLPNYLPFRVFYQWLEEGAFLDFKTAIVLGYFALFLGLFYTVLNRKVYG